MRIQLTPYYSFDEHSVSLPVSYEAETYEGYKVLAHPVFSLSLVYRKNRTLKLAGSGSVVLSIPCGRCLKPVETEVSFDFDYTVSLDTKTDEEGEEIFFLEEDELDVDELLSTEIRLNMPYRVLCKDDCKGICDRCGADLNLGPCQCESTSAPTKMAEALQKAFQQNKQNPNRKR